MSHPVPSRDYSEQTRGESDKQYNKRRALGMKLKVTAPVIHNSPEFKELRKTYQGINATTKGSVEKSKKRHESKLQALKNKMK